MLKNINFIFLIFLIKNTITVGFIVKNVVNLASKPQVYNAAKNYIKPNNMAGIKNVIKPQNIIKPQNFPKKNLAQNLAKNLKNNNKVFEPFIRRNVNNQPIHRNMFQKHHFKAKDLNGNGIPRVGNLINNGNKGKINEILVEQTKIGENMYEQMMNKRIEMRNKRNLENQNNIKNKNEVKNDLPKNEKNEIKNDLVVKNEKIELKNDLPKYEFEKVEQELELVNDFIINPRNPGELVEPNLIKEINKRDLVTLSQENKLIDSFQIKQFSENMLKNPNFVMLNNNLNSDFVNPLLQNPEHLNFLKNLNQNSETQNMIKKIFNLNKEDLISRTEPKEIMNLPKENGIMKFLNEEKGIMNIPKEEKGMMNIQKEETNIAILPKQENGIMNIPKEQTNIAILPKTENNIAILPKQETGIMNLPNEQKGISTLPNEQKGVIGLNTLNTSPFTTKFMDLYPKSDLDLIKNNPLFNKDIFKNQPQFLENEKMKILKNKFEFLNEIDDIDKKLDSKKIKLSKNNDLIKNLGMDEEMEMIKKVANYNIDPIKFDPNLKLGNMGNMWRMHMMKNTVPGINLPYFKNLENLKQNGNLENFQKMEKNKKIVKDFQNPLKNNEPILTTKIDLGLKNPNIVNNYSKNNYVPMMYSLYDNPLYNPLLMNFQKMPQIQKGEQNLNQGVLPTNNLPKMNPEEKIDLSKIFIQNPNILSLPKVENYFFKNYENNPLFNFKEKKNLNFEELKNNSKISSGVKNIYGNNYDLYPNYMQDILKENPNVFDKQSFRQFIKIQKIIEEEKEHNLPLKIDLNKFDKIKQDLNKMQMDHQTSEIDLQQNTDNNDNYEKKIDEVRIINFENNWKNKFLQKIQKFEIKEKSEEEIPETDEEILEKLAKEKISDKIFSKMMDLPFYNFMLDLEELCIDQHELVNCRKLMKLLSEFYSPLDLDKRRNYVYIKNGVEGILQNNGFVDFLSELKNLDLLDSLSLTFAKVFGRLEYLVFDLVIENEEEYIIVILYIYYFRVFFCLKF